MKILMINDIHLYSCFSQTDKLIIKLGVAHLNLKSSSIFLPCSCACIYISDQFALLKPGNYFRQDINLAIKRENVASILGMILPGHCPRRTEFIYFFVLLSFSYIQLFNYYIFQIKMN